MIRIGVVGDFSSHPTKVATNDALAHAAAAIDVEVDVCWIATDEVDRTDLSAVHGFFIAPGSPYRSLDGALRAIRCARENGTPLIGTCGGFQHAVIEYARNVLGIADADHAEYDADASCLVITPLECSLAGRRASVFLAAGSRVRALHGVGEVEEEYRCTFGLNPEYRSVLEAAGLRVTGRDTDGEPRVMELANHPFFIVTLYVPQLSSRVAAPHPLVKGFVRACTGVLSEAEENHAGRSS